MEILLPLRDRDLDAFVRFEGWDILETAQARGHGVVCAVAHFGNFELLSRVAPRRGVKLSIIRNLRTRGATLELHPCTASAEEILGGGAHAVFLANGPGDPAALDYVVATVRELIGQRPVYGICLGHQLLCRAVGLDTFKLPFGHHGANHPVKDLTTGKVEIVSMNHGFAIDADTLPANARVTHVCCSTIPTAALRLTIARPSRCSTIPRPRRGPGTVIICFAASSMKWSGRKRKWSGRKRRADQAAWAAL